MHWGSTGRRNRSFFWGNSSGVSPRIIFASFTNNASYCAGLINHSSAVKVSYYRGELAAKLAEGDFERHSMLSVGLSVTELEFQMEALKDTEGLFQQNRCTISCINSPSNVTVSAPLKDLDILHSYLTKQGVFVRRLQVGLGYHSAQMRQISPEYVRLLGSLESGSKMERTRMISSVTGCFLEADLATKPTYWDQNMVSQVNFVKAANRCVSGSTQDQSQLRIDQSHLDELVISGIIEIGPHSTLKAPIRQILDGHGQAKEVFYVSALVRDKPAKDTFLGVCGRLFCENVPLNVELLTSWCRTSPIAPKVITQLPRYPFDHSILYWEESRSNRASRLQKYPFNKFLGLPLSMGAVFDTRWRLILRVDEQPWIKDHVINGANVYPGSGMLSMALEAAKQLLCERPPKAFIFQDVEFVAPILLSDAPAGTEVEISLVSIRAEKGLPHYHFRIATWRRDETCEEVCRGSISPDYGRDTSESDLRQRCESPSSICAEHDMAEYTCNQTVDDFYGLLKTKCGAEFGPSFRRLHNISANDEGKAIASLAPYEDDCIVHPVILDAVFQVGQAMARETRMRTMVPRRVGKLWISASGIGHECSSKETVHAQAKMPTRRTAICSISVLHQASRETRLTAEDFEYTVVSEGSDPRGRVPGGDVKHLAAHMIWKPDPSLLATDQLEEYLVQHRDARDDPVEWFREFEVVVLALAARGLSMIENSQLSTLECNSYISWLKKTVASSRCTISQDKLDLLDACIHDENALEALSHRIAMQKAGRLYVEVGQNLTRILTGEVDPLTLIFKDEQLMSDFYDEMLAMSNPLKPVQAYVDVLVHKRPNMKFLEIGAGTGGSTQVMLEVLDTWAGPRYGQYVFTDIGPSFLERGRARFSDKKNMQFRTLNIETDPLHQGFLEHEFDVVVADMVLHATSDLNKTLRHLRKVLKPGGKLIMKEMTTPKKILAGFVFGLLPGWWLSVEECRIEAQSPCIDEAGWDVLLKSNHFSGAEVVVRDYEAEDCHTWSFLFSTATEALQPAYHPERPLSVPHIVTKKGSTLQANLAEKVYDFLELAGAPPKAMSLDEAADSGDLANRDFVILLESEEPILVDPTRELFGSLQKVLYSARSIIWVTQSSCTTSPGYGIITGLARVLRTENNSTQIVTLQLETQETAQIGAHVSSLFKVTQESLKIRCDVESEYLERSNILHINRIVSSTRINEHIFRRTAHPVIHQPIGDSKIRLGIRALGLLDTLEFSEEMSTEQELASDEVLIRVHSIGVNFKDCLTLLGRIDTDDLGSECAGTVVQRGGGCGDISPGARVVVLVLDAYRSFVRTTIDRVTIIPDWMSFAQAASVLTAFCTARFSLIHVARLQKNEKVLIHAAAGGTGQAAVQVSQTVGAEIFVTVGSLAKKQLLVDVYGIPESHIFYSRDSSFSRGIMEATNRQGVDVILNSLAGKLLQASWETIANFGRFVEIGRSDIDARGTLPMYPFRKNASFTGVDLTLVIDEAESDGRQRRGTKLIKEVMDQMEIGSYKPIHPIHEYDIGDIEQALRFLQSGKSSGKVVVNVSQDSVVPVRN
jgi:NADPH:quinone reductase-like Zn-dependent oxidoreductase/ubiquinone/menaquinone biosynthesis C-methylase UbiE